MATLNDYSAPITALTTIPASKAGTGTVSSTGTLVSGTSTDFQAEVVQGDWVYDAAQEEIRRIKKVSNSGQLLEIDEAFTADLSSIAFVYIKNPDLKEVSLINNGAAAGTINGATFPISTSMVMEAPSKFQRTGRNLDPIVVNGTGTSINVQKIK